MTTIVILSDPSAGEEALGRMFNGLATAHELAQRKLPVQIVFQGTGTRWPAVLAESQHPAHTLFTSVRQCVAGASLACTTLFAEPSDIEKAGMPLLANNQIPGTPGLASIASYASAGPVLTF